MAGISHDLRRWFREGIHGEENLWHDLAVHFSGIRAISDADRFWLSMVFFENRRGVQNIFRRIIGEQLFQDVTPLLSSTPKKVTAKNCICNKRYDDNDVSMVECSRCNVWYHTLCIHVSLAEVEADDNWICGRCAGDSVNPFPEDWANSAQLDREPLGVSTVTIDSCMSTYKNQILTPPRNISASSKEMPSNIVSPSLREQHKQPHASGVRLPTIYVPLKQSTPNASKCDPKGIKILTKLETVAIGSADVSPIHRDLSQPSFKCSTNTLESADSEEDFSETKHKSKNSRTRSLVVTDLNDITPLPMSPEKEHKTTETQRLIHNDPASWLHASYRDFDDFVRIKTSEETVDIPKMFEFTLPYAIFNSYIVIRTSKSGKRRKGMAEGWLDVIRKEFKKHNKGCCVFNFKRQEHLVGRFGKIYRALGYCSFLTSCWNKISVDGFKDTDPSSILFRVSCVGTISHTPFLTRRNKIQASCREALKEIMKNRKGDSLATEMAQEVSSLSRKCGNLTETPTAQILRQIRYEMLKKNDLDASPTVDLLKRLDRDPNLSAYIQGYSVKPLSVVMFTKHQLGIIKALYDTKHPIVLHVDATGGIVRNLAENFGDSQVLLYAIVVDNPKSKACPMAVCEFLSNSQNTDAISHGISLFRQKVTQHLQLSPKKWLKRVEVDFSLATIAAVIQNFWPMMTLQMYLNMCWLEVFKIQSPSEINLHVCRSHNSRTLYRRLVKCYGKDSPQIPTIQKLTRKYLHANNIYKLVYYVSKLFRICSSPQLHAEVEEDLRTIASSAPSNYAIDNPIAYEDYINEKLTQSSIVDGTSFGKFFTDLLLKIKQEINSRSYDSTAVLNPFFNDDFIQYIIKHILPYTPLLTHLMFTARNDETDKDDQSPVEIWNNIIKNHEQCRSGKLKLSRYVQDSINVIKGRCNRFEAELITQVGLERNVNRLRRKRRLPHFSELKQDSSLSSSPSKTVPSFLLKEEWNKPGRPVARRSFGSSWFELLPFVKWGTYAADTCDFLYRNTCSFDNTLFVLLFLYESFPSAKRFICGSTEKHISLRDSLDAIVAGRTNQGKTIWLQQLRNYHLIPKPIVNDMECDEFTLAVEPLAFLFYNYIDHRYCAVCDVEENSSFCPILTSYDTIESGLQHVNNRDAFREYKCRMCKTPQRLRYSQPAEGPSPFIVFNLNPGDWSIGVQIVTAMQIEQIPFHVQVLGQDYELLACSLYQRNRGHFVAIIRYQNQWFLYDGMEMVERSYQVQLPVVIDCPEKLIELLESYLGYQPLNWDFKIPKSLFIVTAIVETSECIDLTYDDVGGPVDSTNEGLHHKMWLPKKDFLQTDEGRLARGARRKRKRKAAANTTQALNMTECDLGGNNESDNEMNSDKRFGIIGSVSNLSLEESDLSTALHSNWINNFLIDFYAELLVRKHKPYGTVYFPSDCFGFHGSTFRVSERIAKRAFPSVSDSTGSIVTISNFGAHWILILADKKSMELKIIDTLRGQHLRKERLAEGFQMYGDLMTQAFRLSKFANNNWSVVYFKEFVNQNDSSSCGPATLFGLEKVLSGEKIWCTDPVLYQRYRKIILARCLKTTEVGRKLLSERNTYTEFLNLK